MSMGMVAHVRDFSKSKRDTKFLLLTIASYINPTTGWAWPSLDTLAHVTSFGKPYLLKMIRSLEALGELEVRRGRGRGHSNHYRIMLCHEPPPERPEDDNNDHVKGNPRGNHFPGEKVIGEPKKVIEGGLNGNLSGYSKERLESRASEKVSEKVIDHDADEWLMQNRYYGMHLVCGAMHQPGTPCYLPNRANTSLTPVRRSADRVAVCPVSLSALSSAR
jgi:Helix-turn-helix domain